MQKTFFFLLFLVTTLFSIEKNSVDCSMTPDWLMSDADKKYLCNNQSKTQVATKQSNSSIPNDIQRGIVHSLDPNGDGFLSIRTKPKGKEIGKLYNGNKVKILSKKGKYYKIKKVSSGQVGWAHGNWIRKISSASTSNTVMQSSKKEGVVYGLDPNGDGFLALRSKYKTGRRIGKLYEGDKVKILTKRGKWYKVKTVSAGQVGWAHGNWVKISSKYIDNTINTNPYHDYYRLQVYNNCFSDNHEIYNLNKYCKCKTEAIAKVYKNIDEYNRYFTSRQLRLKYKDKTSKYKEKDFYCLVDDEIEAYAAKEKYEKSKERITEQESDKRNTVKWVTPSKTICENNGGKVDGNGHCRSNWTDGKQICSASNGMLPSIEKLANVVTDCGGSINEDNKNNLSYSKCYKEKGFIDDVDYWSSSLTEISHTPKLIHVSLGSEYSGGKGTLHSVVCHIE